MNGFRLQRKKKLTAEQGAALATVAARQQTLPALVGAKWALIVAGVSVLLDVGIILYLVVTR